MSRYIIKHLEISQHVLVNPLSEKHKYKFWIWDNPYSVDNKERRLKSIEHERIAKWIGSKSKVELISLIKTWESHYMRHNEDNSKRMIVIKLIKKALQLH